jgi:colanic acid/amylovoran biosynthesis glycosyltransferase
MNAGLAIFTTEMGAPFIDRHVEDLLPGATVAVARYSSFALGRRMELQCPVFFLDRWALGLSVRLRRRLGVSDSSLREAAIERFLRRHGVTAVLGEYLDQFVDFVPLLDRMKLPYVVQGHGIDVSAAMRDQETLQRYGAYVSARAILTRCEFHRQRLLRIGLPPERVHVNPGGVHVPTQMPQRGPDASKRLLAIARMAPKKGPIYLLEAFRIAVAYDPELTLDFIGGGPLFPAVRQFVYACGLHTRVRLHGAASDDVKQRLLRECGVFVQHSLTDPETGDEEGLPAAIQEAMAYGMAVVSTRHSGIPEAVIDGSTGLLVDEGSVKDMAKAFLQVASSGAEMGKAGYRRAAAEFTAPQEAERLSHWLFDGYK